MNTFSEIDVAQPEGFRPLSMDLRVTDAPSSPLIVFLHGGGWMRGTRKAFLPGSDDPQSFDRLVAAGFAVASCEYRLSGESRFPTQLDDVDAAIDWLTEHGAEHGIDPSRMVLWGVSAGATLAALTGLRRSDIAGVIDWFGPTDLFGMADVATEDATENDPAETREARWLGAVATEVPVAATQASPALQAREGAPPFHIAHGTADRHVPFAQSEALAAALTAHGVEVEFHPIENGEHFWKGVHDVGPLFDAALAFATRMTRRA